MKNFFAILFVLLMALNFTSCRVKDGKEYEYVMNLENRDKDGCLYDFRFNKRDKTAAVVACLDKKVRKIRVPSKVIYEGETYVVTSIGRLAFKDCDKLTSVSIPGSVKRIFDYAFSSCKGIASIHLSDGVEEIGLRAFGDAINLKSIYIPKSVKSISYSFPNTDKLKAFVVAEENEWYSSDDGVLFNKSKTELIDYPNGKTGLYIIPKSIITISGEAFAYCQKLDSVCMPLELKNIGPLAFLSCGNLSSVTIPEGIISIEQMAFCGCEKLTFVKLPNSLKSIGEEAFADCTNLERIFIPMKVNEIEVDAFARCANFKEYIVSDDNESYSSIDGLLLNKSETVLLDCPWGKKVCNVPSSVEQITFFYAWSYTFAALDSYNVSDENNYYTSVDGVLFDKLKTKIINYPEGRKGTYNIPEYVDTIAENAFYWSRLSSVSIPASVKTIEKNAFYHCEELRTITVSEDNEYYCSVDGVLYDKGKKKMLKCPENKKDRLELPESEESIDFTNGESCLEHMVIPQNVREFGDFYYRCDSLKSVTFKATQMTKELESVLKCLNKRITVYVPQGSVELYKSVAQKIRGKSDLVIKPIEED